MTDYYTDADVQAAMDAIDNATLADGLGVFETGTVDRVARSFLAAVAPAIAARALREAAWEWESLVQREKPPVRGSSWLARRADEIEAGR